MARQSKCCYEEPDALIGQVRFCEGCAPRGALLLDRDAPRGLIKAANSSTKWHFHKLLTGGIGVTKIGAYNAPYLTVVGAVTQDIDYFNIV